MKKLFWMILSIGLVFGVSSCGKSNSSGGGGVAPSNTSTVTSAANLTDYESIKNYYLNKNLSEGLSENMVIYHIGEAFGGSNVFSVNYSDIDLSDIFDFNFDYCINLFGKLKGDCANNQSNYTSNLTDVTKKGEYKVVKSIAADSVNYDVATGMSSYGLNFQGASFNRDDALFSSMLNLAGKSVAKVVVSDAKVYITQTNSDGTTSEQREITAKYVEYFFMDNTIEGYILSSDLPVIANPIAVTKNHNLKGTLSLVGSIKVVSIAATIHTLQLDPYTGTYDYKVIDLGQRSIRL